VCDAEVVLSDDKKQAFCTGGMACSAQLRERLKHYTAREAMNIEGLGDKRAEQLVAAGLISRLSDLYTLEKEDLLRLERYADKSAQNLLDEIEESLEQDLDRFVYALGIPLVGTATAQQLARRFSTLDDLMSASEETLQEIEDIGPEVAQSISAFFDDEENRQVIDEIRAAGLCLDNPHATTEQPLEDQTFVFTGRLDRFTRSEAKRLVEQHGGRATSSVSGNTDYVVAGPGAGQKKDDADERGIPALDEEAFLSLLRERGIDVD